MHRDVKTANVLLDERHHAKLSDFGIATYLVPAAHGAEEPFRRAEHTAETGTYRHMAPEVILHKPYNHKCDLYSYGMMVWEVLHRQLPFAASTPLQAAFVVAMQGTRPAIDLRPELRAYAPMITACWHAEPESRPEAQQLLHSTSELQHAAEAQLAQLLADTAC